MVTADYGMNNCCTYNGVTDKERQAPLYVFSDKVAIVDCCKTLVRQLQLGFLLCHLLTIKKSVAAAMQNLTFI